MTLYTSLAQDLANGERTMPMRRLVAAHAKGLAPARTGELNSGHSTCEAR